MFGLYGPVSLILTLICLIDLISVVKAETCPSGLSCDYYEYCCGDYCCTNNGNYTYGYSFYNLWYFWFIIVIILMTCCSVCSYIKRRQYYMRQQQALSATIVQPPGAGTLLHAPPTTYGLHQGCVPIGTTGPPVGAFPGPPAYSEVTDKPDQFPKADYGYPNYGFTSPPCAPSAPSSAPYPAAAPTQLPPQTNGTQPPVTNMPAAAPYPPAAAPYPPAATAYQSDTSVAPLNRLVTPPPYSPVPSDPITNNVPASHQTNPSE